MREKGFTLLETLVASALLLAAGTVIFTVARSLSQSANTVEDAASLEAQLSLARQTLEAELTSRPFLAVRAAEADYLQVLQAVQAVSPIVAPAKTNEFPSQKALTIPSSTPTSNVSLAAVSNGAGDLNVVPYERIDATTANLNPCVAGVEYRPTTAFIPASTVEVATGSAIKRRYGTANAAELEDDTLYVRRDAEPWRPLLRGVQGSSTLGLLYARDDGALVRAPDETDAPWRVEPEDPPGAVYPKPFFRDENERFHQLQGLVLSVSLARDESRRTHEVVVPLTPLSGHEARRVTECSPAKRPEGELVLDVRAPSTIVPEEQDLVTVYGPDPRVNGKSFGPGRHVLSVFVGDYILVIRNQDANGERGVRDSQSPQGYTRRYLPLRNPLNPSQGYFLDQGGGRQKTTVSTLSWTEEVIVYEEMPALLRVSSRNFYVAAPFQLQIVPLTVMAAVPPPALFTPRGERFVLGREVLGGFIVAQFATAKVQQGSDSDFLITKSTLDTANDERGKLFFDNQSYYAATGPWGIGYPYSPQYGLFGYPVGGFGGSLLVKPGTYKTDISYWAGTKLTISFAFFYPILIWSPCSYIYNSVDGNNSFAGQKFFLAPGSVRHARWEAVCLP